MLAPLVVVWIVAVRFRNAGIVDVAWSANFTPLALLYAVLGTGFLPRRLLIGAMTIAWSLRLASYLRRRVMGAHPVEDGRYGKLREQWAPGADRRFFWFFQLQAGLDLVRAAPRRLHEPGARTRGEDYREYQRTTSVFFPWPPGA